MTVVKKNSQSGFSIVTALMAMGLLGYLALSGSSLITDFLDAVKTPRVFSTMTELELDIISATQDASVNETFNQAGYLGSLNSGTVPSPFQILSKGRVIARSDAPLFFDTSKNSCTNFGQGLCLIRVEFHIRNLRTTAPWDYRATYRIEAHPSVQVSKLGNMDPSAISSVPNSTLSLLIAPILYSAGGQCGFAMRGFNPVNGNVTCWEPPQNFCDHNSYQIPVGFQEGASIGLSGGVVEARRLEFQCQPMANQCPAGYALGFFDAANPSASRCVPTTRFRAQRAPNGSCPANYSPSGTFCVLNLGEVNASVP